MSCEIIHSVKRGDSAFAFQDHIQLDGESVDLADATVAAVLNTLSGDFVVSGSATILQSGNDQDMEEPNVQWLPDDGDLDIAAGIYNFEWKVTLSSERTINFPRDGYHRIRVWEPLNAA